MKKIIFLCLCMVMLCFSLTACGNDNADNDTTGNSESNSTSEDGLMNDVGNDVGNAIDDIGDAVDDVANDVGDAVSNGFETYDDAYNHFMSQLPSGDGKYEVRNNDKDLTEYTSGRQGYHFELHDTTLENDSKLGDFYLDSEDGKIYHSDDNGKNYSEYDFSTLK